MQPNKQAAEKVMLDWVKQAQESKVPQSMKMAVTIMAYRTGILAWYDCPISTGKVEGINNKIKVMKRVAYGFRDERYFQLSYMRCTIAASLQISDEPEIIDSMEKSTIFMLD